MPEISNAEHLRNWLFGCEAIDATKRFGVDYLGDEPTEYALITVSSPQAWQENILGQWRLKDAQEQDFIFALRGPYGADMAQNLRNLAACQAVVEWIVAQNAAGAFPEWEGGIVTGVTPVMIIAPVGCGSGAQYQIQIRVRYVVVSG